MTRFNKFTKYKNSVDLPVLYNPDKQDKRVQHYEILFQHTVIQ